jgi:hypothetical protein
MVLYLVRSSIGTVSYGITTVLFLVPALPSVKTVCCTCIVYKYAFLWGGGGGEEDQIKGIDQREKRWFESGSIQSPSSERPKTAPRTLFLLFANNNCIPISA